MYIVMYMTFITDGHIQCCHSVTITCTCVHVQLTGTADLWDYLLLRVEGEVLGGMQGLQGMGGGSFVSWRHGGTR